MWFFFNCIVTFLQKFVLSNNSRFFLSIFFDWLLHCYRIRDLEDEDTDAEITNTDKQKYFLNKSLVWFLMEYYTLYYTHSNRYTLIDKPVEDFFFKNQQLNNNKFYDQHGDVTHLHSSNQVFLYGLKSIWSHLRLWVLPITIAILFIYYSFVIKSLPFSKIIFGYIIVANLVYLFLSGFVFFIKKYQYRLFTSAIQRFWRRSLIIFWAIEGFLFLIFIYLIFNASQEPVYVYDNIQIYKTHFYSWRYFLLKIILSALLIVLTYTLMLSLKWNTFTKVNNFALFITIILLYLTWLEFYQLFHLMNCYGIPNWVYDFNEHLWNLEVEFKRTRIVNHYVTIGLVAKFWHIIFAVVFWVFFLLRGVELSRYRYPLLAANLQNFLIIYVMSWLYMYPWFKFVFRKGMDMPYFWFFVNNRRFAIFLFFNDIKLYWWGFKDFLNSLFVNNYYFNKHAFFYWHESSNSLGYVHFRKHNIRDLIIKGIN